MKKNHHFVPQFYLKRFSHVDNKRAICLYNFKQNTLVHNASIRHQSSCKYFYGLDPTLEDSLSRIECRSAEVIRNISNRNTPPDLFTPEHHVILTFTLDLYLRTLYAIEAINEMLDRFTKHTLLYPLFGTEITDLVKVEYIDPTVVALHQSALNQIFIYDLKMILLVNNTKVPFISSDNPCVFYNQYMEQRNHPVNSTGLNCKGLQIILPIDPKRIIVFYDGDVYRYKKKFARTIEITNNNDVKNLNSLQIIAANENIYFDDTHSLVYISSLTKEYTRFRRKFKASASKFVQSDGVGEEKRLIVLSQFNQIRCHLRLTFLRISKSAKKYKVGDNIFYPRNPKILKAYRDFSLKVKQGVYSESQFLEYLSDIDE